MPRANPRRLSSPLAAASAFRTALATTDELTYDDMAWLGMRFAPAPASTKAWIGLTTPMPGAPLRNDNGRLVVLQVRRGTPAFDAGINAEDEILAIIGNRVRPDQWEARLDGFKPGDTVPVLVAPRRPADAAGDTGSRAAAAMADRAGSGRDRRGQGPTVRLAPPMNRVGTGARVVDAFVPSRLS